MKLERVIPVVARQEVVWRSVVDVRVLAECIPGVELGGQKEDGSYYGSISFKTGPKAVRFDGVVKFRVDEGTYSGELEAVGSDKRQASRAKAQLRFAVLEQDGVSEIDLSGDVMFFGALAEFAESGGVYVGEQLMDGFASQLAARMSRLDSEVVAGRSGEEMSVGEVDELGEAPRPVRVGLLTLVRSIVRGLLKRERRSATTTMRGETPIDEGL